MATMRLKQVQPSAHSTLYKQHSYVTSPLQCLPDLQIGPISAISVTIGH